MPRQTWQRDLAGEDQSGGLPLEKVATKASDIEENNNPKAWGEEQAIRLLFENLLLILIPSVMEGAVFSEAPESSVPIVELSPTLWPEPRMPVRATHG